VRIYNRYIASLAITVCLICIVLAALDQDDLAVYFTLNVTAYLVITLLYAYLNPRTRRSLKALGMTFFAGFLVVVALKVADILQG